MQKKIDNMDNSKKKQIKSKQDRLKAWLRDEVDLEQYFGVFIENGFDSLEEMKMITMDVLNMIGINKIGHKMKLLKYITKLNDDIECYGNEGKVMKINSGIDNRTTYSH